MRNSQQSILVVSLLCLSSALITSAQVKNDPNATAPDGSAVLEKLKSYDSIYEAGFTVSGMQKSQDRLLRGPRTIKVERNWRLSFDSDRCGYLKEVLEYEKPKFQEPNERTGGSLDEKGWLVLTVRTKQWGYWGDDVSGNHYEDAVIRISPENEVVETGKMYNSSIFGPKAAGPNIPKRTVLWSLGRLFSRIIDEVTLVKESTNGLITVLALAKKGDDQSGRWELTIEPAAAWMVHKARFYSDTKPDVINCEMKNSGIQWSGSYCIPQKALFNYLSSIDSNMEKADELMFVPVIENFDEALYEDAKQAVTKKLPPKLTVHDYRGPVPLVYQPDGILDISPKEPISIVGRSLPEFKEFGLKLSTTDVNEKIILVCFFDYEQRPSRNCLIQLSKKAQELKEKDIVIVAIQASKIDKSTLDKWIKEENISFPIGMTATDEEKNLFSWGVNALPWLILTDKKHVVINEGFSITELDEKIRN